MDIFKKLWLVLAGLMLLYIFVYLFILRRSPARREKRDRALNAPAPAAEKPVRRENFTVPNRPEGESRGVNDGQDGILEETVVMNGAPLTALEDGHMVLASGQAVGGRESQQDSLRRDLSMGRAAVVLCDGMGGMEDGRQAAELASGLIFSEIWQKDPAQSAESCFQSAAAEADERIAAFTGEDGRPIKAGTTVVAVYAKDGELTWLSVGDSRIYLHRDGTLTQLTRDHNFGMVLDVMAERGRITRREAMLDSRRAALVSYLGMGEIEFLDTGSFTLRPGDIVLLTSDGTFKALSGEDICRFIDDCGENAAMCAQVLVSEAVRRGGRTQDNTTAALLCYKG